MITTTKWGRERRGPAGKEYKKIKVRRIFTEERERDRKREILKWISKSLLRIDSTLTVSVNDHDNKNVVKSQESEEDLPFFTHPSS